MDGLVSDFLSVKVFHPLLFQRVRRYFLLNIMLVATLSLAVH